MKNRKGVTLSQAPMAVLTLVFIGLLIIVGAKIFTQVDTTSYDSSVIVNETITTWTNNTYEPLARQWATGISSISNTTNVIGSGNYTLLANESASAILIQYSDAANNAWLAGSYNVSYPYNYRTQAYYDSQNATGGLENISTQMTLIGLIIGLAIVIRILWGSFGGMFKGGAGQGL